MFAKNFERQAFDSNGDPIKQTFIVKPSHDCQGRGIYLMNEFNQFKS